MYFRVLFDVFLAKLLQNLRNALEASGSSIAKVVKTTCYLRDMSHFTRFNTVYAKTFTEKFPARTTVAVVGLPKDALVEIEVVATL